MRNIEFYLCVEHTVFMKQNLFIESNSLWVDEEILCGVPCIRKNMLKPESLCDISHDTGLFLGGIRRITGSGTINALLAFCVWLFSIWTVPSSAPWGCVTVCWQGCCWTQANITKYTWPEHYATPLDSGTVVPWSWRYCFVNEWKHYFLSCHVADDY
jgi:hypothetical protein